MILSFESADRAARLAEHPTFPAVWHTERLEDWEGFERRIEFASAYDGRHEPENYGVHCAEMTFVLIRDHRAISGGIMTGWQMEHVAKAQARRDAQWMLKHPEAGSLNGINGSMIGHHSPTPPRYWALDDELGDEGPLSHDCEYTGGTCYFDGSGLAANDMAVALVGEGWMAVWEFLRRWYRMTFEESDGTHYTGRVYTGFLSRTEKAPLWSEYTAGHRALVTERQRRRKEHGRAQDAARGAGDDQGQQQSAGGDRDGQDDAGELPF